MIIFLLIVIALILLDIASSLRINCRNQKAIAELLQDITTLLLAWRRRNR